MRNIVFATVAAFGLAVSASAFAMASNDRITTNSTALPHGITLSDISGGGESYSRSVADNAGGGESHGRNGSLSVADAGGGESHDQNGPRTVA
jgi:hypothetical protein